MSRTVIRWPSRVWRSTIGGESGSGSILLNAYTKIYWSDATANHESCASSSVHSHIFVTFFLDTGTGTLWNVPSVVLQKITLCFSEGVWIARNLFRWWFWFWFWSWFERGFQEEHKLISIFEKLERNWIFLVHVSVIIIRIRKAMMYLDHIYIYMNIHTLSHLICLSLLRMSKLDGVTMNKSVSSAAICTTRCCWRAKGHGISTILFFSCNRDNLCCLSLRRYIFIDSISTNRWFQLFLYLSCCVMVCMLIWSIVIFNKMHRATIERRPSTGDQFSDSKVVQHCLLLSRSSECQKAGKCPSSSHDMICKMLVTSYSSEKVHRVIVLPYRCIHHKTSTLCLEILKISVEV